MLQYRCIGCGAQYSMADLLHMKRDGRGLYTCLSLWCGRAVLPEGGRPRPSKQNLVRDRYAGAGSSPGLFVAAPVKGNERKGGSAG